MPWAQEQIARSKGQQEAAEARRFELDPGPFGGFVASTLSSIPELFGADASSAAEEFRNKYPVAGFVSELAGSSVPYFGWAKATTLPRAAAMLEGTVAKTGLKALEAPVRYQAVKEIARFAPLELSRLGVGFTTMPTEDYGNLLADVGLSVALAGAGGSILGFLKAGGKRAPDIGHVAGRDIGLKPTFELRMANAPEAQVTGEVGLGETQQRLLREVLTEKPANKQAYVAPLEGADPKTDLGLNSLFRAQASKVKDVELDKRTLEVTPDAEDARRITEDELNEVLGATGFKDINDLASTLQYPRLVTVKSQRAAGALAKMMDDNPALQWAGDGVLMGREANGGLWVTAKRIRSGAASADAKPFGTTGIAEGDRWLIGKTDKPQRLVPEAHKVAEANVAQWAKYAEAYRPIRDDVFNKQADMLLEAVSPTDYRDLGKMTRSGWIARMNEKLTKSVAEGLGISGSTTGRQVADWLYDVLKPTIFKEGQNPLYGRLFSLMRNNVRVADERVNKMMPEIAELYRSLSPEDFQLVARAAKTQTPAEDLAKLSADGLISQSAANAVKRLQEINKQFLDEMVMPGLKSAGFEGKFDPLEGYILPRVFKGDWQVDVRNDKGVLQWLSVGKTPAAAKAEADAVVEEATARGLKWTRGEAADHAVEFSSDEVGKISQMVAERMAVNADAHEVVQAAMRRLAVAKAGRSEPLGVRRALGSFKERQKVKGTPDVEEFSVQDAVTQTEAHYRSLGHFVGVHTWRERWLPEAFNLEKIDKTLYTDLLRKSNQFLSVPGKLTKMQDELLRPVLGGVLGSKPASKIAEEMNGLMYAWNLAIVNPSFALLNLISPLQTVAPHIAYLTKVAPEYAAKYMQFIPRYGPDGLPRGSMGFWHPMKVLGQATKMLRDESDEIKQVYERARGDGTLAAQLHEQWVGGHSRNALTLKETWKQDGPWEFIKKTSTIMATKSEEYSRMISFNAMYLLGRDHFGLAGDALYRFARRGVEVTMYNYSVVDRPRMFTGPAGSMFGLFKNWQFHFIGQMAEYARVGINQGVWGPMLWQGGAALAVGGLGATPLKLMADGLASWYSEDKTSYLWLQNNWHDSADEIYFGLPAFLGISLQQSSMIPGTDVRNDLSSLSSIVAWERAKALGKAVGAAWNYSDVNGENPLNDPAVRDKTMNALLPRAFIKVAASVEGDYVRSLATGYPQTEEVSAKGRVLNAMGFNPLEVQRQTIAGKELYTDQQATRKMVQGLGTAYADAQQNGDWDEMEKIIQRAIINSVPVSSVMQSAQTRLRREQGSNFDRYDAAKVAKYKQALGVE